ncbi:MAG: N-acetylmuramic acid 6-phosphate etherase [Cyclobacteriaceae bacterium]|nr:N-acetylmuramic acid 6-phosphate etherase [Cyclobacteriaceae bacterium]
MTTTESPSLYQDLEKQSVHDILTQMNDEDQKVPGAVRKAIPQIGPLVENIVARMKQGGRLFYIGSGTSGRLGILDASECPPTFGVEFNKVIGLISGGDVAIRKAVENAEDDPRQAWLDLSAFQLTQHDTVIGIAASGRTPYVIGGVTEARKNGLLTGCITCNEGSALASAVDFPIEVVVGPEYLTGSTRLKSGTAQKLVLNMVSTSVMIRLGHVKGNKMVDMQLSNEKLVNRGVEMLMEELGTDRQTATDLLLTHGSVRKAIQAVVEK